MIENEATWMGGAIFCQSSRSLIKDNIICGNAAIGTNAGQGAGNGGGIGLDELDVITVSGNLVCGNTSTWEAGGVWAGDIMLLNLVGNTITDNSAASSTGGVFGAYHSVMTNNIIWGNSGGQIYQSPVTQVTATYCDVQGGWTGTGNINEDPSFVDTSFQEYRLLWDSPCIDSGHPDSLDPDGTRSDIGAFYYDQSAPVRILLTPHQMPYLIPETGGWMDYTLRAFNRDSLAHTATVWCDVALPNGSVYGPVLGPASVTIG